MSMRDIHFGVKLDFNTPEDRDDSEDILLRLLGVVCRLNLHYLKKNPDTLSLYDSGVMYAPPDQLDGRPPLTKGRMKKLLNTLKELGCDPETALMVVEIIRGTEIFLDIPALYRRGKGDCNELVPVRVAELWRAGIGASPYLIKARNDRGGYTYHAIVQWPDGSAEDPSLILGMGGEAKALERREEIRKNAERWDRYMKAAAHLVQSQGIPPKLAAEQVDKIGLAPKDGVFRLRPV